MKRKMDNFTDFERKLAALIPNLRRDVKSDVLRAIEQPLVLLKLQLFQKALQHRWRRLQASIRQFAVVGICCFFLGAAAMYGVTTYFSSECFNRNLFENSSIQANQETVRYEIVSPPMTAEFLDDINSPIELMRKIPRQQTVRLPQSEQKSTQYQILRDFQT
ncbi:MAG: hypothetical protein LBT05_12905 [Planctomycetaceae bacterium]|nr:hypothetical protein [Planctomycetaceae bacterium]